MRDIKEIIVHCSDTPEGKDFTVLDIDKWHREKGYKMIGYHFVIYLDGTIHKGRELKEVGAHCKGHNKNSIGICYIGGKDNKMKESKDTRTLAQRLALGDLLLDLKLKYPNATIHGHCEFANKACPSFDVKEAYKWLF